MELEQIPHMEVHDQKAIVIERSVKYYFSNDYI